MQWVEEEVVGMKLGALPSLRGAVAKAGFFGRNVEDTEWLEGPRARSEPRKRSFSGRRHTGNETWVGGAGEFWGSVSPSQRGILEAWLTLFEGLVGVVATCPRSFQAELLGVLMEMLESLQSVPGQAFGDYCLRHSVLPMLQQWLRLPLHHSSRCMGYGTGG